MYKVIFNTNIDFYSNRSYPTYLPFRPQIEDHIPFIGQDLFFRKYPSLCITRIKCCFDEQGTFTHFECNLYFHKNVHESIVNTILNHKDL